MKFCAHCNIPTVRAKLCQRCYGKEWRANNKDKHRAATKRWEAEHRQELSERKYQYYLNKKDKIDQYQLQWKRANYDKTKAARDRWRTNNPDTYRAYKNARRHRTRKATPRWVDMQAIRKIYNQCPNGQTVDHIVPINGKTVSGLHVPWNLQYLSKSENSQKSNKLLI